MAFGIDDVIGEAIKIVNKFVPDKTERERIQAEIAKAQQAGEFAYMQAMFASDSNQVEVNKIEAANPSLFVSGWRPAVGWVCVIALACYYIPRFTIGMLFWSKLAWIQMQSGILPPMPEMGIGDILGLVGTLLGSSAIRAFEKYNNVARMK